jgi:nascent polypeptide-associated complex subunit alpha
LQAQQNAADNFRFAPPETSGAGSAAGASSAAVEEEEEDGEEVDETGVEPKDIELVMTQVRRTHPLTHY